MDKPTIDQINIVIARFMGLEGSDEFFRQNYQYHKSWDMLMPVIKRIREQHTDLLLTLKNGIGGYIKAAGEMNSGLISCDIAKAHAGVFKFIQWYNQNKNNG